MRQGFRLALTAIEVLPEVDVSMCGLYNDYRMYTPLTAVGEQTEAFLSRKVFSQAFDSDVYFIRNFFRQSEKMDVVSEKPLVQMRPEELGRNTQVHVASNNAQLQLVIDNPQNIYHGKTMEVHIADTAFSQRTRTAGLYWLQELYRFLIGAGLATVVVLHDDYRFRQTDSGRGLHCYVVPDWKAFAPAQGGDSISLTKQQIGALKEKKMGGIDVLATLPDGGPQYSPGRWRRSRARATSSSRTIRGPNLPRRLTAARATRRATHRLCAKCARACLSARRRHGVSRGVERHRRDLYPCGVAQEHARRGMRRCQGPVFHGCRTRRRGGRGLCVWLITRRA